MPNPTIFALDFDGVLCDSAGETCAAAWRAGRTLWPGWEAPEPPPAWVDRFRQLRPVLETGYQAIALLRLVEQERRADCLPAASTHPASATPAGNMPGQLTAAAFAQSAAQILATTGLGTAELIRHFGAARDSWIAAAPEAWLARHEFYPGVPAALNAASARGCPLFILTTKQHRFTERLLRNAGVELPSACIFGLETKRPKEDILPELLARPECRGLRMVFVEDRREALDRAAAVPALAAVDLRLATWGYCGEAASAPQETEGQGQKSPPNLDAQTPTPSRIRPWLLAEFTAALAGHSPA